MLANIFRDLAKPPPTDARKEEIIIAKNEAGETVILENPARVQKGLLPHFGTQWLTPRKV